MKYLIKAKCEILVHILKLQFDLNKELKYRVVAINDVRSLHDY